jgi:hypothetical protein
LSKQGSCAKFLFRLSLDRNRLEWMSLAGRKTARKRFCSSLVAPHYVRYYESVLGAAG